MKVTQRTLAELSDCSYYGDGGYHFVDKQVQVGESRFNTYINENLKIAILAIRGSYSLHEIKQDVISGVDLLTTCLQTSYRLWQVSLFT
jgi:hypothetical protein